MDTNQKISQVGVNIQEKASVIWNVANSLFGAYKPHEYGLVILPMVVIKRFHDCLLPNHDKVVATFKSVQNLAVYFSAVLLCPYFLWTWARCSWFWPLAFTC